MTATELPTFRSGGARAVPGSVRGWDIYFHNTFKGNALTPEAAKDWIEELSGEKYNKLPAVKLDEIRVVEYPSIEIREFGRRGWYMHQEYFYGEKSLGRIQTKVVNGVSDVMTLFNNKTCIKGASVKALCTDNDLRLVT